MAIPIRTIFLLLIAAQAAHSVEEYFLRLYDLFAPTRYVSGLLGFDRGISFAITNAALILFGLWCYLARVRPGRGAWRAFAWLWAVLEIANGLGHGALAFAAGGYFPGLATALVLVALGAWLALRLCRQA